MSKGVIYGIEWMVGDNETLRVFGGDLSMLYGWGLIHCGYLERKRAGA